MAADPSMFVPQAKFDAFVSKRKAEFGEEHERVGSGTFGAIYRVNGAHIRKVIDACTLLTEVLPAAHIASENIVRMFAAGMSDGLAYIDMEACIDVAGMRSAVHHTPERMLGYIADMARALRGIHALGLVHCDVKMNNFVFRQTTQDSFRAVLCDFGKIRLGRLKGCVWPMTSNSFGAGIYKAPETILLSEYVRIDSAVDMYALGVTIPHMHCSLARTNDLQKSDQYDICRDRGLPHKLVAPQLWSFLSYNQKALLEGLLHCDPASRPTAGLIEESFSPSQGPPMSLYSSPSITRLLIANKDLFAEHHRGIDAYVEQFIKRIVYVGLLRYNEEESHAETIKQDTKCVLFELCVYTFLKLYSTADAALPEDITAGITAMWFGFIIEGDGDGPLTRGVMKRIIVDHVSEVNENSNDGSGDNKDKSGDDKGCYLCGLSILPTEWQLIGHLPSRPKQTLFQRSVAEFVSLFEQHVGNNLLPSVTGYI